MTADNQILSVLRPSEFGNRSQQEVSTSDTIGLYKLNGAQITIYTQSVSNGTHTGQTHLGRELANVRAVYYNDLHPLTGITRQDSVRTNLTPDDETS